jgi:AmmeMemoRadiSam system protein A
MPPIADTPGPIPPAKGALLLRLARLALAEKLQGGLSPAEAESRRAALADPELQAVRATFVTLKRGGELRGCIGTLCACEPLAASVRRNSCNAAFCDPRFPPLAAAELAGVTIEVSVLSEPRRLEAAGAEELLRRLRPGVDGVVLRRGGAGATFLPQVWDQLARKEDFLKHLCLKAGLPRDAWREAGTEVSTYQVQHFEEGEGRSVQ